MEFLIGVAILVVVLGALSGPRVVHCRACGGPVSTNARHCPHCGDE